MAKQLSLFKGPNLSYGGLLLRTRKGRSAGGRPLSTRDSLHLVLRSFQAKGEWSLRHPKNKRRVLAIVQKFATKYAIDIKSMANVGNHLHFHIQLKHREGYKPFIRAITGAIAMAVTGASRWRRNFLKRTKKLKFWDYRPFTRVVRGFRAVIALKDYIQINFWESQGLSREEACGRVFWKFSSA